MSKLFTEIIKSFRDTGNRKMFTSDIPGLEVEFVSFEADAGIEIKSRAIFTTSYIARNSQLATYPEGFENEIKKIITEGLLRGALGDIEDRIESVALEAYRNGDYEMGNKIRAISKYMYEVSE